MAAGAPVRCLCLPDLPLFSPPSTFLLLLAHQRLGTPPAGAARYYCRAHWLPDLSYALKGADSPPLPCGETEAWRREEVPQYNAIYGLEGTESPHPKKHCSDLLLREDREAREGQESHIVSQWSSMDWGPEVPTSCHSCGLSDG